MVASSAEVTRIRRTTLHEVLKGSSQEPLVVTWRWSTGYLQTERLANPERSQILPIYFMYDETVFPQEVNAALGALSEVASLVEALTGKETEIFNFGHGRLNDWKTPNGSLKPHCSVDWYVRGMVDPRRNQVDGYRTIMAMKYEPYQLENPHHDVILTGLDLWDSSGGERLNFIIGDAYPDIGTIVSARRFRRVNTHLKDEVLKTVLYHEYGHVLGLPNEKRAEHLVDSLGNHCSVTDCSMKQGIKVPYDFEVITRARLQRGWIYCPTCLADLERKFRV